MAKDNTLLLVAVAGGAGVLLWLYSRSAGAAPYPTSAYPGSYFAPTAGLTPRPGGGMDLYSYLYGAGRSQGLTEAQQQAAATAAKSPLGQVGQAVGLVGALGGVAKTVVGTVGGVAGSAGAAAAATAGQTIGAAYGAETAAAYSGLGLTAPAEAAPTAGVLGLTTPALIGGALGLAAVAGVVVAGQMGLKQDVQDFQDSFAEGIQPEMQRPIEARIADIRNIGAVVHPNILISVAWDALYALGWVSNRDFWPTDPNEMDKVTQPAGAAGRARANAEGLVAPTASGADLTYSLPEIGRDIANRWGRLPSQAEYNETIYQLAKRCYGILPTMPNWTPQAALPAGSFLTSSGDFGR